MSNRTLFARSCLAILACAAIALCAFVTTPSTARADVPTMPDVTDEMGDPAFWYNKVGNPNTVLADQAQIAAINDAILHEKATTMNDLAAWEEGTYDGKAYAQILKDAAEGDFHDFYSPSYWGRYYWDEDQGKGVYLSSEEEARDKLYGPMIENAAREYGEGESTTEPFLFAICTTRTCVLSFPSNARILDAEHDPDFDYQYQTMVRVGEPLVIQGVSSDSHYYHVFTSCTAGWVAAADVAVCANKEEWLNAWDFAPEETLVVCDSKIVTEESAYAPAASQKLLSMGTCLKLATPEEYGDGALLHDINRAGYNCHVVWLPIRKDDGSYDRMLALISEHCKVSEGFLPLTYENIAKVALNQLGDEYGWGGMLSTDDCSGYVRDVYKCFGLELARNTTWQEVEPVRSYGFQGMDSAQREELIRSLPLGTVLFFGGHEMIYLGAEGDNLYVISSVSSASLDGESVSRLRGCLINTLDVRRGALYGYITWLDALTSANIPYLWPDEEPSIEEVACECKSGADAQWAQGSESGLTFVFDRNVDGGSTFAHFVGLSVDGVELVRDVDYVASEGSVIIELKPAFLESLDAGTHSLVATFDDVKDVAVSFSTTSEPSSFLVRAESTDDGFVGVSTAMAPEGTVITVTVRPFDGRVLEKATAQTATGAAIELQKVDDMTFTFAMPAEDVTVSATFATVPEPTPEATVTYRTHVQTDGWQEFVSDGVASGTEGQAKRLEGIEVKLQDPPAAGSIEYRTHVQTYGWQDYVRDGAMSGTEGQSKRLEAIQIRLTGEMANVFDVWYRVHAQTYGWLGWAKNDSPAGTSGLAKRLEAIEIVLLPKGSAAPSPCFGAFISNDGSTPEQTASGHDVAYRTHIQTYGWQGYAYDGQIGGTEGQAKRLEGIDIRLASPLYSGAIEYRTHVQTYGWQDYVRDGAMSGTEGQSKRLEAIQIRLTDQMAEHYDVWYRVHAQTYGWLDWACNDEPAGTTGLSRRLEGIQVLLLPKGSPAPGPTDNALIEG